MSQVATVAIVGADGFLGSHLVSALRKKYRLLLFLRNRQVIYPGLSHFYYSFEDKDFVNRVMTVMKPNTIVYAAGIPDFMECHKHPKLADNVHALGAVFFSAAAEKVPHRFIYISSSYIFNGLKGNYTELDVSAPETTFGRSKIGGENYVAGRSSLFTILRCAPILGPGSLKHGSWLDGIKTKISLDDKVEVAGNEIHNFMHVRQLCDAVEWVIQNENENKVYHLGGLTKLTTYKFVMELAKYFNWPTQKIISTKPLFPASDMLDFSLDSSLFLQKSKLKAFVLEESLDLLKKDLVLTEGIG